MDAGMTLDSFNARNAVGLSGFQIAAGYGHEYLVETILESVEEGREQDFVNEVNPITGDTALMIACMKLELDMVKFLLSKRADPNARCFDTDDHDFLIQLTPCYYFVEIGTFNDARHHSL